MEWLRTPRGQVLLGSGVVALVAVGIVGYVLLAGARADATPNVPPLERIGKGRAQDVPGLDHRNPDVRLRAVRKVKDTLDPNTAQVLLTKMTGDEDETVRLAAAEELASLKDRGVLAEVLRIRRRGPTDLDRRLAAIVLGGVASDQEEKDVYEMTNDPDPVVRRSAARAIGNMRDKERWKPILAGMLRNQDASVRFEAARTAKSAFDQAWSIPLQEEILHGSEDPQMRRSSIIGLGMLASPAAVEALGRWLTLEPEADLRKDALSQIATVPGQASRAILERAASEDSVELVRSHAAALLKKLK